jgi:16S rRNA processing protein RimM
MPPVLGLVSATLPADAVEVGRIQEAWGIKGWAHVHSHSAQAESLLSVKRWYLQPPTGRYARGFDAFGGCVQITLNEIKPHSDSLVAHWQEVPDRSAVESLKGARIFLSRADFPPPADPDEYYWVDLIGLQVVNREGVNLGVVNDLLTTGPHSVLCLEQAINGEKVERMIPFVSVYVDAVDRAAGLITVDWQPDY